MTPPLRSAALLLVRLSFFALIVLVALASCEFFLRVSGAPLARDIVREWACGTHISGFKLFCENHRLVFISPDRRFINPTPNLKMTFSTGSIPIQGCSHGFRKNGLNDEGPVFGIVIGDSFTINDRLDDTEGWVSLLSRLSGRRFMNFGMAGAGTLYHRRMAELLIPILRPRFVIVQLSDNDLDDDRRDRTDPRFTPDKGDTAPDGNDDPETLQRFQEENLERIYRLARDHHARMGIVAMNESVAPPSRIDRWRAQGVPVYVCNGKDWGHKGWDIQFKTDKHLNFLGNEYVARGVYRSFLNEAPLPEKFYGEETPDSDAPWIRKLVSSKESIRSFRRAPDKLRSLRRNSLLYYSFRRWILGHRGG
ncbi:MAG TPA: hypothetical protein PK876_07055 [Elusimicrobiota bacterium]|nr:hypothetical protein [Elusimicrobiota bacterium]